MTAWGQSDKTIFAVSDKETGEVMVDKNDGPPSIEIRLWRKR